MSRKNGICIDCEAEGVTTKRPAPHPGPRCVTHKRARKKVVSARAHELRTEATYGLTGAQYWAIHEAQGGCCYICLVSKGIVRRLAVDHDHKKCDDHPPEMGCPRCVRALLCKRCNQLIAWWGVEALQRAIEVLTDPPAQRVLAATITSSAPLSCYRGAQESTPVLTAGEDKVD